MREEIAIKTILLMKLRFSEFCIGRVSRKRLPKCPHGWYNDWKICKLNDGEGIPKKCPIARFIRYIEAVEEEAVEEKQREEAQK